MTYDQRETQSEIEAERDEEERDPEADRLVSEIEETRSGMGATIDQIGHRLQPQTIADEAVEKIREATVGRVERVIDDAGQTAQRTSNNLIDTIRQNPVPAALAGLGIGWLALRMRDQGSSNGGSRRYGNGYGYGYSSGYADDSYRYGSSGSDPLQRARGVAEDVIGGAQSAVGDATGRAQEVGSDIQRAAQTAVGDTQQKVQQAQGQAQDVLRDAQGQFDRTLNENPLALGALALGVGAAVALAIPETQKEREIYGEHRDKLVEQVSTVASQALDQAQTKVEEVATQATEQVSEQDQSDS